MGDKIGNRIARKARYNRRSMEANSQKENKLVKRWEHFAHKVLRSKKSDFKTLLKSFPDFKIFQGTPLYHMVDATLQSYVKQEYKKTAAASTRIPPIEKKKITLAQLIYFYFCFRFFPYTIYPDDTTDIQRTGIAIVRDNSPRNPTYGNGTYNDYFNYESAAFVIQTGQPGAVGEPNPGPVQPLGITYNPDDGTDPDLQKMSAGARFSIHEATAWPWTPKHPGAMFFLYMNQFSMSQSHIPLPFHPAWAKGSSVPSINEISSYPYNPWPNTIAEWFREPTWSNNLHYYEDYMDMPPEIEIPAGLPVGYIPASFFDVHSDPQYWATHAFDIISVKISDNDIIPLTDILVVLDPLDHGWTNKEVTDWLSNFDNEFWGGPCREQRSNNINTAVYDAMKNYTVNLLRGDGKLPLSKIKRYLFGLGGGFGGDSRPGWYEPGGVWTWKRYLIPEKVVRSHADVYTGPLFPVCQNDMAWGCFGKCID